MEHVYVNGVGGWRRADEGGEGKRGNGEQKDREERTEWRRCLRKWRHVTSRERVYQLVGDRRDVCWGSRSVGMATGRFGSPAANAASFSADRTMRPMPFAPNAAPDAPALLSPHRSTPAAADSPSRSLNSYFKINFLYSNNLTLKYLSTELVERWHPEAVVVVVRQRRQRRLNHVRGDRRHGQRRRVHRLDYTLELIVCVRRLIPVPLDYANGTTNTF